MDCEKVCAPAARDIIGLRSALVIAEVITSVVLLTSSGLLIRALWRVQSTDPGFRRDGILTMRTELPWPKYEKLSVREQFYNKVLGDIRSLPGVTGAAYTSGLPMRMAGGIWPVIVNSRSASNRSPRAIPPACASLRPISSRPWEFPFSKDVASAIATRQTGSGLP